MNDLKLSGIVLSGGKSSRMGKDKGLMLYNNKPLIYHSIYLLKKFTDNIYISTSDPEYKQFSYPVINDLIPGIGPIGGIYSVVKQIQSEMHLIVACDMPFASEDIVSELLIFCNNYDIVVPVHNNKTEPLLGLYSSKILDIIEEQINCCDYKLMNLLKRCNTKLVDVSHLVKNNSDVFKNLNTPNDTK